ncbi:hypothetical protein JHK82_052516 [Glycine max]|uniref:Ribulose bisphosphate carboxylase small subunit n=1 Tax=Glycine soja TaxID=3848 RepID=A0A0B2PDZ3_GLYSO|nr:hypothetical protein JHK86_052360 [Glycine max]KAG4914883.1 hypothetical protein JHK87_052440 [Glycine soja]KAG4926730.1 hypothetical protein JHK85_053216 [Glycine max]KAG5082364.1 hypothetical protein JHK84_052402 [Glycine max]KAG5085119.1 hypothetical protein JHK82_052516 [Glycine max]
MASSPISSPVVTIINRVGVSMVAPFTGLKSMAGIPTRKTNSDITSIATNGGRVWPPVGKKKFGTFSYLPDLDDAQLAKEVLKELQEAKTTYPNSFIRIIGFDNIRQVQCISFIAYKPPDF